MNVNFKNYYKVTTFGLICFYLIMSGALNSPFLFRSLIPRCAEHAHHVIADICVSNLDRPLNILGFSFQKSNSDPESCSSLNHTPLSCCCDREVSPITVEIVATISRSPVTPDPAATIPHYLHRDIFWTTDRYSISLSIEKIILFGPPIYLRNSSFLC